MSITELGGSERMSIKCRKTKTKEITTAKRRKEYTLESRWELKVKKKTNNQTA